jgi:hypothetical protein
MRKIIFVIIGTLLLIADDLPKSLKSTISTIDKNGQIILSDRVSKDMSGIVVHSYGNGLFATTYTVSSSGGNRANIEGEYQALEHENLPTIKTAPKKGDRVIFGSLYSNVLLLAPDEKSYSSITKSISDRVWIHPDIYAYYLIERGEDRVTLDNLKRFALENQVGLVAIVGKDEIKILDPISGKYIKRLPLNIDISKAQSPFFARFELIDTDIFSRADKKEFPKYYRGVESIK